MGKKEDFPPAQKKKILSKYLDTKGTGGVGRKPGIAAFNFVTAKEQLVTETRVKKSAPGKFMWKDEYVQFAQSVAGGSKSKAQAEAQWSQWEIDISVELRDDGGPKESPLRFWVKTGDFMNFEDIESRMKVIEGETDNVKKPAIEDIARLRQKAMSGHDNILGQRSETLVGNVVALLKRSSSDLTQPQGFADDTIGGLMVRQMVDDVGICED